MKLLIVLLAVMAVILNSVMSVTGSTSECRCHCPLSQSYEIVALDAPSNSGSLRQYSEVQQNTYNRYAPAYAPNPVRRQYSAAQQNADNSYQYGRGHRTNYK